MRHIKPTRFTQIAASSAPNSPGVYVLWTVSAIGTYRALYVGVSKKSIRTRLTKHFTTSHNSELNMNVKAYGNSVLFCWLSTQSHRAKFVETYLIRRLRPTTNISENS